MTLTGVEVFLVLLPGLLFGYAYVGYPVLLKLIGLTRPAAPAVGDPVEWPSVTIVVPAYNEERAIRRTIESLLAIDYPAARRQILVLSDASTDGTDEAVRSVCGAGRRALPAPRAQRQDRGGKHGAAADPGRHRGEHRRDHPDSAGRLSSPCSGPSRIRAWASPRGGM